MTSLGWTAVGFLTGVAASAVAFAALPSLQTAMFGEAPGAPPTQVSKQAEAPAVIEDERHGPDVITNDPLAELDVTARIAILRYMAANPEYAFITRDYCGCHDIAITNCPEYDARRELALRDYPYSEVRDYNGDRHVDFAVVLETRGAQRPEVFLLFNGPFGDGVPAPAFRVDGLMYRDHIHGTFLGPPESDNGYSIKAKGPTYELVYMGNPG